MNRLLNNSSSRVNKFGGLLIAMAIGATPLIGWAENPGCTGKYQGKALWNLKGNVKSVEYDKTSFQPHKKVKFTEEGKVKNHPMSYDKQLRPIGYGSNFNTFYSYLNVAYDDNSRPERMRYQANSGDRDVVMNYSLNYEGDLLISILSAEASTPEKVTEWSFSDYKYDPQGNWVSRKVRKVCLGESDAPAEEFTETRKIEYFK